jgi:hypothetical protein
VNLGPHQLWDDPWEGMPPQDAPWNWELLDAVENGPTKNPPDYELGWKRWYFTYRTAEGELIRISADRDPVTGKWFNPHYSSGDE